jgi:hypothetical protein
MKRGNIFRLIVSLLLLLVVGMFVFSILNYRTDRDYASKRTKVEEVKLATALERYFYTYGTFPTGNVGFIERILSGEDLNGENPKKEVFLAHKPSIEHLNEMVDSWGTPFQIGFSQTTNPIIHSAGPNKKFGDQDDIIFNSVSNDFVKP